MLYGAHYIIFGSQALRLERSQVLRPHFCLSLVVRGRLMALASLDSLIERGVNKRAWYGVNKT